MEKILSVDFDTERTLGYSPEPHKLHYNKAGKGLADDCDGLIRNGNNAPKWVNFEWHQQPRLSASCGLIYS